MSAPCKNCPDREIGCHSRCNKYLEFRKKRDEALDKKRKEADVAGAVADGFYRMTKKRIWVGIDT